MIQTRKITRHILIGLTIVSLALTIFAATAVTPAYAAAGDYCIRKSVCGWCHSATCTAGGQGLLYYGYWTQCFNKAGQLISSSPKTCGYIICGLGTCQ